MENIVENFLKVSLDSNYGCGSGDGYGEGDGSGYVTGTGNDNGCGYDNGSGYGDGCSEGSDYGLGECYGTGTGDGYSDGHGSGNGYECGDVKVLNGQPVYLIDGLPTIIISIHNNVANGYIVREDLTLKLCYIAKVGRCSAHGYSVKQALADAQNKYQKHKPIEERLADFNAAFPDRNKKIPARELYKWHNILTGSCEFGRQEFCKDHKIDIDKDLLTVNEFITLTADEYGGDIITQL